MSTTKAAGRTSAYTAATVAREVAVVCGGRSRFCRLIVEFDNHSHAYSPQRITIGLRFDTLEDARDNVFPLPSQERVGPIWGGTIRDSMMSPSHATE